MRQCRMALPLARASDAGDDAIVHQRPRGAGLVNDRDAGAFQAANRASDNPSPPPRVSNAEPPEILSPVGHRGMPLVERQKADAMLVQPRHRFGAAIDQQFGEFRIGAVLRDPRHVVDVLIAGIGPKSARARSELLRPPTTPRCLRCHRRPLASHRSRSGYCRRASSSGARSSTSTDAPALRASSAALRPARPAPMTTTSGDCHEDCKPFVPAKPRRRIVLPPSPAAAASYRRAQKWYAKRKRMASIELCVVFSAVVTYSDGSCPQAKATMAARSDAGLRGVKVLCYGCGAAMPRLCFL